MAEVRGDECLPQGWKVEVRVRKSGRKDRYYTDPASGYVFRSLRDIDRYLLTGKFGRHAMKSKNNNVAGGSDPTLEADEAQVEVVAEDASKAKGSKKVASQVKGHNKTWSCFSLIQGVGKRNSGRSGEKKPASGGTNSNQKLKNRKISVSAHRKGSDDFFILEGADGSNELGLPNFREMIESSEDSRNGTYLSAPEIALLLGRQMPHENASKPLKSGTALDSPLTSSWEEICSDPCIEFAVKTLTGAIPLESVSDGQMGKNRVTNGECPPT